MDEKIKKAIEEYQCPGCIHGSDISCYEKDEDNIACKKHYPGTMIFSVGKVYLGLPMGFNRLGPDKNNRIGILEKFADGYGYNKFNIPVWKYLNENGHVIVRGISPRINSPFIHIYLENCLDQIDCLEITKKDIEGME